MFWLAKLVFCVEIEEVVLDGFVHSESVGRCSVGVNILGNALGDENVS